MVEKKREDNGYVKVPWMSFRGLPSSQGLETSKRKIKKKKRNKIAPGSPRDTGKEPGIGRPEQEIGQGPKQDTGCVSKEMTHHDQAVGPHSPKKATQVEFIGCTSSKFLSRPSPKILISAMVDARR
ncbi:hypothetical protein EGW08_003236 [Elysia chlorotica]|uniref:Uncharacterized protein n=1 Tax=Elysia chlorotica TaxID=188477 RepID=A0A433U581_ELYCH|nr:hypothetical protein EGW08_003236 [Elysia chlorotica]